MLLLVLILVLIAFGLLVVALLTGNVLCAWLSVAVSVAAAVVLVVDWLQRRSALKAGGAAAQPSAASADPGQLPDLDPVTEVLPVVPAADTSADQTAVVDPRHDDQADSQRTIVLPAVQPSGSVARPSGAQGPTTPSSGSSSPSVMGTPSESSAGHDVRSTQERPRGDAESTVVVDIRKAGLGAREGGAAPGAPQGGAPTPAADPGTDTTARPSDVQPSAIGASAGSAAARSAGDVTASTGTPLRPDGAGTPTRSAAAEPAPGGAGAETSVAAEGTAARSESADAPAPATVDTRKPADSSDRSATGGASVGSSAEGRPTADPDGDAPEGGRAPAGSADLHAVGSGGPETKVPDGRAAADTGGPEVHAGEGRESEGAPERGATAQTPEGTSDNRATGSPLAEGGASSDTAPEDEARSRSRLGAAIGAAAAARSGASDAPAKSPADAAPAAADSASRPADAGPPAAAAAEQPTRATFGGTVSGPAHELFDPVSRSAGSAATTPPPPPETVEATAIMSAAGGAQQVDDGEPPEEPLDPVTARIVAGLDDEVVVIDEQPRYHVHGCRAVAAQQIIPLPAREAVELGFTPCGWCTPDAVLAARHRASARP